MDLRELGEIDPKSHWYYQSKKQLLSNLLLDRGPGDAVHAVVDIGAGSGFFSNSAREIVELKSVIAVDVNYKDDQIGVIDGVEYRRSFDHSTRDEMQRTAWLFMDVIEHVEEDTKFLAGFAEQSRSGDVFLITVPAFQALWSSHDDFLGHYRRYTRRTLTRTVRNSGLQIQKIGYFYVLPFPIAAITRLADRFRRDTTSSGLTALPTFVNRVLLTIMRLEFKLTGGFARMPGLTAVALATKI